MSGLASGRGRIFAAALFAATTTYASLAAAEYPERPITLVVPFTAGGGSDTLARIVAEHLEKDLGQRIIVENRGGAAGNIGAAYVAKAAPDGYTLIFMTAGPAANNKLTYKSLPYDPETDFEPIMQIAVSPMAVVAYPGVPANNLKELVEHAKAHPGEIDAGVVGIGSLGHLVTALLETEADIKLNMVPYSGSGDIIRDLIGGQIDLTINFLPAFMPHVQSGAMKALAVTTTERVPLLPDTATAVEQGINVETSPWYAIEGPAGMPREAVDKINASIRKYLATDEAKEKLATLGMQAAPSTPEELKTIIDNEVKLWAPIITKYNITSE